MLNSEGRPHCRRLSGGKRRLILAGPAAAIRAADVTLYSQKKDRSRPNTPLKKCPLVEAAHLIGMGSAIQANVDASPLVGVPSVRPTV